MTCYCIVTARSLLWMLLTIAASVAMLSAILTPMWLVSRKGQVSENATERFYPSVGIYNRCIRLDNRKHCAPFSVEGMSTPDNLFPTCWKFTLVFLSIGLCLMSFTVGTSVLGFCVQSICKKSIFTISGALQSTAGIFYILGLVVYPFGWGSERVQRLCGSDSTAFYIDGCTLGWAFYSAVIGLALTFACAVLSMQAEVATSSDKVQYQIHKGRTLICVP